MESNALFVEVVELTKRNRMKLINQSIILAALLGTGAGLFGQGARPGASDPAFDISGYWSPAMHEDALERGGGSELGDYAGFALNEAGRLWALSYDSSRVTLRHHQCDAYVAPYQMRATGNFRMWEERDPHNQKLVAVHIWAQTTEGHRVVWMDGRPHPPAWAPHSFRGFSTGKFVGNVLVVETTHMKQGWLRRNGTPQSDQGDGARIYRAARRPSHGHRPSRSHRPRVLSPSRKSGATIISARWWIIGHGCMRVTTANRLPAALRIRFRITCSGNSHLPRNSPKVYKLPVIAGVGGRAESIYPEFDGEAQDRDGRGGLSSDEAGAGSSVRNQQGHGPRAT